MTFVTWGYRSSDILLSGPRFGNAVKIDDLVTHPVWHLDDVTFATSEKPRPMITYFLSLRRKPRYIVSSIILPLIILNVCVFILPSGSGEKVSYAITVFLSFVVFSTLVHETLPVNSENVCYLSVFITVQVFESAAITILAILLIRLEKRTDHVPIWLIQLVYCTALTKRHTSAKTTNDYLIKTSKVGDTNRMKPLSFADVNSTPKKIQRIPDEENRKVLDWEQTVNKLELVLFGLFLLVNAVLTSVFFASISR